MGGPSTAPMRPLPTLRQLLVLLALGCVLPMAALALGLVVHEYQRGRHQEEIHAIGTARAMMAAVDDRFDALQHGLYGLANSPALMQGDEAKLYDEAQLFVRMERVRGVVLAEAGGQELLDTEVPLGQPLPVNLQAQTQETTRAQRPTVLNLFRSPVADQFLAAVALPLPRQRVLEATLSPEWVDEVLQRQKLPATWIASVLDGTGRIVARTHEPQRFLASPARASLVARIGEIPEDAVESVTLDGTPVVAAFSRSTRSGWTVVIGIPQAELGEPMMRSSAILVTGTALMVLATLWLAWRLARGLGASVEALGGAARATGHGVPLRLPPAAFQEAHLLGQALLHASAEVEDAQAAEQRLQDRLQAVLDAAINAVVVADAEGRIVVFNRSAQALFRLPDEDALGREIESLLPPAARERHRQLRESLGPESVHQMAAGRIVEGLRDDGTTFRAQIAVSVTGDGPARLYTAVLRPTMDAGDG
jgi:PAS domain S-box-containing protein